MKKRITAILLAACMLLPTATGLLSCKRQTDTPSPTTSLPVTTQPLTSARAVDKGDMTYYLDNAGTLFVSYGDDNTQLAALSATQICVSGDTLWYTAGNSLFTYDLPTGERRQYASYNAPITTFALYGDKLYYLCEDQLFCGDKLLIDLASRKASDGASLSAVCDFELKEEDLILLYLPNPHYQDENAIPGYLLSEQNDAYITYRYQISSNTLAPYDYAGEQSGGTFTSTGGAISINGVTLPFADYPVGSYFTQNGGACTCHNRGGCVANTMAGENCLRYWPNKTNVQIDLCGVQCMGFARFCQWRLFGVHDYMNTTDFYNAFGNKLSAGSWTANTVKNVFLDVGPGGHIRTGAGHSLFVISVSASGFVTYECNTNNKDCKVYTRQWTWDSFFSYAGSRELLYYNMPRNFSGGDIAPEETYEIGAYRVAANGGLNLRPQPNTNGMALALIPNGAILQVTAIQKVGSYYWGHTSYDGKSGWVRLDYAVYQKSVVSAIEITTLPTKVNYTVGDEFSTAGMTVEARFSDGTAFDIAGYSCSGYNMNKAGTYTVTVAYGSFSDTFTITVKEKHIPPTSISLELKDLTLIVGDQYQMGYTLLPVDTTQKTITWTSSAGYVATVSEGVIHATTTGSTVITAKTENGLTATCKVTVITMPTGTNWSTTAGGNPLTSLPIGIETLDYSIRYRLPQGDGWGAWIYGDIPADAKDYQCQFRSFTATFVNTLDGQTVDLFTVELNQVVNLSDYQLSQDGYLFTGWYYNPQAAESLNAAYAAPNKITIAGDLLLYAGWIPLDTMTRDSDDPFAQSSQLPIFGMAGAQLQISDTSTGVRYLARISTSLISKLEGLNSQNKPLKPSSGSDSTIGYGMVVRMRSATTGYLTKANNTYLYQGGAVTVPAQRTFATYNGYILFNAFICGYTEEYYKTDFVARPYLTYADANGNTHTYYFTCTGANTQGGGYYTNLYAEAEKMAADPSTDPVTQKWLKDNILN